MAWSDEPTDAQLRAIAHFMKWTISTPTVCKSIEFLQKTATRREVGNEMVRIRKLYLKGVLDAKNCFESEIWEGFEHD